MQVTCTYEPGSHLPALRRAGIAGRSRRRHALRTLLALALWAPAPAAGSTLVVDPGGGGATFPSIQAAIDQAAAGDTIVVRKGDYDAFVLGKPLLLIGDEGVRVRPSVVVHDIGAGRFAGLANLNLAAADLVDCDGAVVLDSVTMGPWPFLPDPSRPHLLFVERCRDVRIHGSTIDANAVGPNVSREGVHAVRSRLQLTASRVLGNEGDDSGPCIQPAEAGAGLSASAAWLHVARSRVDGGPGAFYGSCTSDLGGDGGPGIDAAGASTVIVSGVPAHAVRGGPGGWGDSPLGDDDGFSGDGVRLGPESFLRHSGAGVLAGPCLFKCGVAVAGGSSETPSVPDPSLERFVQPDGTTAYRVYGPPGATVRLALGTTPRVTGDPGPVVDLLLAPRLVLDLGVIPAVGSVERPAPEVEALASGLVLAQAEVAIAPGDARWTESIPLLRAVDPCPLEGGPDCNGNGMDDACEIAIGLSADCDLNSHPDDCDIAAGRADLNENGVLDLCESFAILFVDDDAPGDPAPGDALISDPAEDGSAAHPFDGISEAIAASSDGDVVMILDGVYRGPKNTGISNVQGREIVIRSRNGPESCTIDMERSTFAIAFAAAESPATVLDGLTLVNGPASGPALAASVSFLPSPASPTIRNCVFRDNAGSAVVLADSEAEVRDCRFLDNCNGSPVSSLGGAITVVRGRPLIRGCELVGNRSTRDGGAIRVSITDEGARIEGCLIRDNHAVDQGGGVYVAAGLEDSSFIEIRNCVIQGNSAREGGGIYASTASQIQRLDSLLYACTVVGNLATSCGGGLRISGATTAFPRIDSSVIWGNRAPVGAQVSLMAFVGSLTTRVAFTDLEGGPGSADLSPGASLVEGRGNLDVDPGFESDGYHLGAASPLIDRGDPAAPLFPNEQDVDGGSRLVGAAVDLGADERDG